MCATLTPSQDSGGCSGDDLMCPRDEMMPGTHSLNVGLLHEVKDWMQFDWKNREDEQFVL